jgi:hypothetical protein
MLSAIRRALRTGDEDFLVAHWDEVVREGGEAVRLGGADALRVADVLVHHGDRSAARDVIERLMRPVDRTTPEAVAVRLARLADDLRSPRAPQMARDALARSLDIPPETRDELERIATSDDEPSLPDREPGAMAGRRGPAGNEPPEGDQPARTVELPTRSRHVESVDVTPIRLIGETLVIEVKGAARDFSLRSVQAIAVAGIKPRDGRPYLIVDLLLDAPWGDRDPIRVLRLRSNAFDPRALIGGQEATAAFRELLRRLLEVSDAVPLPDPDAVVGKPFRTFDSVAAYQRTVLTGT